MPVVGDDLTVEELKGYLPSKRTEQDPLLELMLKEAFGFAKSRTGRRLEPLHGETAETPVAVTRRRRRRLVRIPDARTITAVTLDGTTFVEGTDYDIVRHPLPDESPIAWLELLAEEPTGDVLTITGLFGFTPIPDDLRGAIYTHVSRNFHERAALYADASVADEFGRLTYLRQLPPRTADVYTYYGVTDIELA